MMIEPRASFHFLRPDSSLSKEPTRTATTRTDRVDDDDDDWREQALAFLRVHPDLEYETSSHASSDRPSLHPAAGEGDQILCNSTAFSQVFFTKEIKLCLSVVCLILCGAGNMVLAKLETVPMYNYGNFLNLYMNFLYIPICFAYIIPVARYGSSISAEQLALSKRPFLVIGALDSLAACMQVFSSVYLPGTLLVLLPQACIPVSMFLSRSILRERYCWAQVLGALIVLCGIVVVLEPVITHRHSPDYYCEAVNVDNDCTVCQVERQEESCLSHVVDNTAKMLSNINALSVSRLLSNVVNVPHLQDTPFAPLDNDDAPLCQWLPFEEATRREDILTVVWSLVLLASTIPTTLSAIFKQKALKGTTEVDPIYLNGWIAVFRFFFSIPLAIPAGLFASPSVSHLVDIPSNLWDGLMCYAAGQDSVDSGCHPDDTHCSSGQAALYVNLCILCNILYSFFILFVLKYGSSAILFLALTAMVPLGHLVFAYHYHDSLSVGVQWSDLAGLIFIVVGLGLYRFVRIQQHGDDDEGHPERESVAACADGSCDNGLFHQRENVARSCSWYNMSDPSQLRLLNPNTATSSGCKDHTFVLTSSSLSCLLREPMLSGDV